MEVEGRKLVEKCRLRGGHDAAVASVLFPQFGGVDSSHVVAEDRLMVTGGNDGSIMLWDLGSRLASQAVDPCTMFVDCVASTCADHVQQKDGNARTGVDDAMKSMSLSKSSEKDDGIGRNSCEKKSYEPEILFGVKHGKKPNYIESSRASNAAFPSSLFVADTSHEITVYSFPRV
jgi:hypothetical protein